MVQSETMCFRISDVMNPGCLDQTFLPVAVISHAFIYMGDIVL